MDKIDKASRQQYSTKVKEDFPERLAFGQQAFIKRLSMRYGENPGTPAAFYQESGASGPNMATLEVLQRFRERLAPDGVVGTLRPRGGPCQGERSGLEKLTAAESTLLGHRVLSEVAGRSGATVGII